MQVLLVEPERIDDFGVRRMARNDLETVLIGDIFNLRGGML
ncbi:MAG: hypothetical protein ACI4QD_00865 [Kiritimatiellia bacterium]